MLGYEYHDAAESEYHEAIRKYARIDAGLGMDFVTEVELAIERARQFPEAYGKVSPNVRHVRTRRFPYIIFYELLADRIFIWAVAHARREPGYWQGRT